MMVKLLIILISFCVLVTQLVLSAEAVVVSLDGNYRPKRLAPELRQALLSGSPLRKENMQGLQELL